VSCQVDGEWLVLNLDVATGRRRWTAPFSWDGSVPLPIAEADGAAFLVGDGPPGARRIERRALPDGAVIWVRELPARHAGISTAPQIVASRDLLAFAAGPTIVALDAATGADRYTAPAVEGTDEANIWQLLLAPDAPTALYAVNHGALLAFDAATGTARWRRTTAEADCAEARGTFRGAALDPGQRDLAILCGQLRQQGANGSLIALDPADGRVRWHRPVVADDLHVFQQIPALIGGRAVVAETLADPDRLTALDPATGAVVWSFPTDRSVVYGGYSATDDRVILATALPRWWWWRWQLVGLPPG